jgi:hypothetical protein
MSKIQKHSNKYFLKAKKIRKLKKEQEKITKAIRNQAYIPLDKPIHHGYNAEYVLRDDYSRRKDADAYNEALSVCMISVWSRKIDFMYKCPKTKRLRKRLPILDKINLEKYENLSTNAKKLFVEYTGPKHKYWRYGFGDKLYSCTLTYEIVVKISNAYITHRREHDSILYQEESELESQLYQTTPAPWGGYSMPKFWRKHSYKQTKNVMDKEMRDIITKEE